MSPAGTGKGPSGEGVAALAGRLRARRGGFTLEADLEVRPGEVVAVVGPNGAGKTTLLRVVAGLERLDGGSLRLGGRTLEDAASGVRVPASERGVGMIFQEHLLFPHLTVLENVAYGPRARGAPPERARRRAREWLARVHVAEVEGRRPDALSGGQARRVALARALASEPDLLLLDEPLSALDARVRLSVRRELKEHLSAFPGPVLVVTHEPADAAGLADRLLVLEEGGVVQGGPVEEVVSRPRSSWVARLLEVNLVEGEGRGGRLRIEGGPTLEGREKVDGPAFAAFDPEDVRLAVDGGSGGEEDAEARDLDGDGGGGGSAGARGGNAWSARVSAVEILGRRARVELEGPVPLSARLTAERARALGLEGGRPVRVSLPRDRVRFYPRA